MLSSYSLRGGKNKGNQKGQQGQQGNKPKQKKPEQLTYIPPKIFGQRKELQSGNIIVKYPDTFQVPFGVPVDPIFELIEIDSYEEIEKILRRGYDLNKKLFEGCYLYLQIALYYGNIQANKYLQKAIADDIRRIGTPVATQTADKIEAIEIKNFIIDVQTCIDETLEAENGETFDNDPNTKANAIVEQDT